MSPCIRSVQRTQLSTEWNVDVSVCLYVGQCVSARREKKRLLGALVWVWFWVQKVAWIESVCCLSTCLARSGRQQAEPLINVGKRVKLQTWPLPSHPPNNLPDLHHSQDHPLARGAGVDMSTSPPRGNAPARSCRPRNIYLCHVCGQFYLDNRRPCGHAWFSRTPCSSAGSRHWTAAPSLDTWSDTARECRTSTGDTWRVTVVTSPSATSVSRTWYLHCSFA